MPPARHNCPLNATWWDAVRTQRHSEVLLYSEFYNKSPDKYEEEANLHLAKLLEQIHPFIRVGDERALQSVLKEDLVKNQFQTGTSKGFLNPPYRQMTELALFDLPLDCAPDQRPVYGYLHVSPDGRFAANLGRDFADNYGMVCLRLRDEVKYRTTFTGGDSLIQTQVGQEPNLVAAPVTQPSWFALLSALGTPLQYPDASALLLRITTPQPSPIPGVGYLEAQYHYPVRRGDIEEVFFYGFNPEKATEKLLNIHKIKWERLW